MEALRVEHLQHSFGGLRVLDDISFSIETGERVALIGPNGAGKTTLFNVLTGFIYPTAGRIYYLGNDVTKMSCWRRVSLHMARSFQITNLFPQLSLLNNVLLAIKGVQVTRYQMLCPITAYKDDLAKAQELLELVDLWAERESPITALSHGQQRKMDIILTLASKPQLLLLDEPSAGLTIGESGNLVHMISNLLEDATILFSAHDLDLVFSFAKRVIVLYYGKIVAQGTPEKIQNDPKVREIYLGAEE